MRLDRLPISVLRTRYVPGGWDVLAFVLVFAFFVYAAQAAHGLDRFARAPAGDADLAQALGAHRLSPRAPRCAC